MEHETTKKIIHYTLMPQIMPRIRDLCFSGFAHIAFFMAQAYSAARLLPAGHPYLHYGNMGRYGMRHVMAEAARNLVFKKENIDQIIIYVLILTGVVILFCQILLLCLGIFVQTAHAGAIPSSFAGFFLTPDATHDIAFVILDRVFGVPGMFTDVNNGTTCVVNGATCFNLGQSSRALTPDTIIYTDYDRTTQHALTWPWPYHEALHKLFEAYSVGLLLIAAFIFLYFALAVIAETAQSGTPFGRRFNHVWAPLRIVAAIGLLVPLTNGLNSAQYILLYAAKWGSGFATNGWVLYNDTAVNGTQTLLGNTDRLVATPKAPPVNTLVEFFTIVATCKTAYERMYYEIQGGPNARDQVVIDAYLVNPENNSMVPERLEDNVALSDALDYFVMGDIIVRFGELRDEEHQTRDGRVVPYCGEVILQVTDVNETGSPGSYHMLEMYYALLQTLWIDASTGGGPGCTYSTAQNGGAWQFGCIGYNLSNRYLPIENDPNAPLPETENFEAIHAVYQDFVDTTRDAGVSFQQDSPEWLEQLQLLGWAGAAIWYNKVAELNGSLTSAVYNLPAIKKYPLIMEKIRQKRANADADTPGGNRHMVYRGPDAPIVLNDEEETHLGKVMYAAQTLWEEHYSDVKQGGNIYIEAMNVLFGTSGLFNIHENADDQIHPLAQLASIGKTIMETAIRNLGYSAAAGLGGGIINLFGDHMVGRVAMTASSFLSQIAMIGITIGFVLFYIIPLLPFIYFFFAVGGWVKGIFEAMVGVPLWALAHLRIDGNGLPGDAALGGYHLILEIFMRPILIIFGFIASITIFSAQVQILHEIWPLVVSNTAGYDPNAATAVADQNMTGGGRYLRGAVDKFFFTVIYAIIVYMLGMSSFKMIDLVPNHILRWLGASVSTFGDQSGDPADNLVRNSFIGSNMVSRPIGQAVSGLGSAAQSGGRAVGELFGRST